MGWLTKPWILQAGIILVSVLLLLIGNLWAASFTASHNYTLDHETYYRPNINARVIEISSVETTDTPIGTITTTIFIAALTREGGREVVGIQQTFRHYGAQPTPTRYVQPGDRILLQFLESYNMFELIEFLRIQYIAVLGAVIIAAIIAFGKIQGLNSLVSLALTVGAIFLVFVPAIAAGANIYLAAILVCFYSTVSTLLIVIVPNKKSLCTMIGCLLSVAFVAFTIIIMDTFMQMTGVLDSDSIALITANPDISLTGIIFAGVVIGAFGAIMDVSMSIASSLWELRQTGGQNFKSICASGFNIGRDILGTMANTLVLAYIGSSLSVILLIFHHHSHNVFAVIHLETIIAELLRALAGIAGIFLAIPITTLVCGRLYSE